MASEAEAVAGPRPAASSEQSPQLSRAIVRLAWPVVIERLSLSVLSAVDAVLVGHFTGADGLAAVGIGSLLFWIPLSGALAIDVGSSAIIARDTGSGDHSRVQEGLHAAVIAALVWGLACTVIVFTFAPPLMQVMGAEPEVAEAGVEYLRAGSLGFPFLMMFYAIAGCMRGAGNTWMSMIILIAVNAVNAIVTLLLINGTVADLGVQASGIGYAAAGISGGVLALLLAVSGIAPVRLNPATVWRVGGDAFRRLSRIGVPVGLEEAQFMLAFLVYTRIVARLGTDQLAAHSLALRSVEIAILPGFALGTAATALVGQQLGAARPQIAEDIAKLVARYAVIALCIMAVVQFVFAPQIVRLFVDDADVVGPATTLLRVFSFALPAMGLHSSLSGSLRGAGDVRFVLATFTFTAWCIRVPIAALMVIAFGFAAPFAWLGAVAENWTRAALVLRRFRQGKWKQMKV